MGSLVMSEEESKENPKSFFFVSFEDVGSVVMTNMNFVGITPLQMIALASWLEVKGKNELIQQENKRLEMEAERNIARPPPGIVTAKR